MWNFFDRVQFGIDGGFCVAVEWVVFPDHECEQRLSCRRGSDWRRPFVQWNTAGTGPAVDWSDGSARGNTDPDPDADPDPDPNPNPNPDTNPDTDTDTDTDTDSYSYSYSYSYAHDDAKAGVKLPVLSV